MLNSKKQFHAYLSVYPPVVLLALLLLLRLVGGGVARGAPGVVTVVTRHL